MEEKAKIAGKAGNQGYARPVKNQLVDTVQSSEEFVVFSYHHPEIFEESKIFIGYGKAQKADFDTGPFPCVTMNDWKGTGVSCWHFENFQEFDLKEVNGKSQKSKEGSLCLNSNLWEYASETPESYMHKVEQIQDAMRAGEMYVMNLCLELALSCNIQHAACKELLISAYQEFLSQKPIHCGGIIFTKEQKFCSFSPEVFLHQQGEQLSTYPIKGTGARDVLEQSAKEASELEMVTDLLRNDLGKIADRVWIERERFYTQLPHFAHAQSEICAQIQDFRWEKFRSLLPCGSMTGAPKSRVLEWTEKLESFDRGLYAGNFGLRKSPEEGIWNILIRTLFVDEDRWRFPVGAGITVESNPQSEAQECIAKAKILQEYF